MSLKLSAEDAHAVDLLLDRDGAGERNGHSDGRAQIYAAASEPTRRRLTAAGTLLDLLSIAPRPEAPDDLTQRTMLFIDSGGEPPSLPPPGLFPPGGGNRPVA